MGRGILSLRRDSSKPPAFWLATLNHNDWALRSHLKGLQEYALEQSSQMLVEARKFDDSSPAMRETNRYPTMWILSMAVGCRDEEAAD